MTKNLSFGLLLALIGVGLIMLWRVGNGTMPTFSFHASSMVDPKPAVLLPPKKPEARPAPVLRVVEPELDADVVRPPSLNQELAPTMVVHPPFPAAEEVKLGVAADAVTGAYGNPSASAVTSANGHMVETLIYAEERGRSATVIKIVDGRVSGAYTKAAPPNPPGSMIRNPPVQN